MNVSELSNLTHWITNEIENKGIPQKYQTLQALLQQHSQPNNQKPPFESQKQDLINTLSSVPLIQLTKDQIEFLSCLGIAQTVGKDGIKEIEDVLYKNVIDVATSARKIQEINQKIVEGIAKSKKIKEGLIGCVSEEEYEAENEILMRVSFTGNALMSNVADFRKWGAFWFEIGRGVAMAHNAAPEEIKIVGATKGSIIIELAVASDIAVTISQIILAALKVAEKVIDIKTKAEELRGLKMKNTKLAKDLDAEAENEKKAGIEEITAEVSNTLQLKESEEGEKIKVLDKAVKNIVEFIEKGGIVDFVAPEIGKDEDSKEDNNKKLRVAFQEIRQLETKMALLEHTPPKPFSQP
jgi:hypothetical protein